MTPLQIGIGGLALMVGLLALAQRLGNWQNTQLARVLCMVTAGLFVAWCFLLFPSWVAWLTATVLASVCAWFLRDWTLRLVPTDVNNQNARVELESKQPRKLNTASTETEPQEKNDLRGFAEFYLNREAKNDRFDALMKNARSVWVATHQATTLRGRRDWWDKIDRLILLKEDGQGAALLASVTDETNLGTINDDIASAIRDAKNLAVKSRDAFFNSVVIGNPNSDGDAWVSIEIYMPWWRAGLRPSIVFTARDQLAVVRNMRDAFDYLWDKEEKTITRSAINAEAAPKPILRAGGFKAKPDIDDLDGVSGAAIEFTRIGQPVRDVTAQITLENSEGFEVQDLPFGTWVGSKTKEVDFGTDEMHRLNVAVKDNSKPKFRVNGYSNDQMGMDFEVEAIDLKVRVLLRYHEDSMSREQEYIFFLQTDRSGRLRLLKQAKTASTPNS